MTDTALSPAFAELSLSADRARRATVLTDTFDAWLALGNHALESLRLDVSSAATLADAAQRAVQSCQPKDGFSVVQTSAASGKIIEHVYRAKRSTKHFDYRHAYDGGKPVRVGRMEVEHLFSRAVASFSPIAKWSCSPGCDVVGIDRSVVESRSAREGR
jgi:hypothetical protein